MSAESAVTGSNKQPLDLDYRFDSDPKRRTTSAPEGSLHTRRVIPHRRSSHPELGDTPHFFVASARQQPPGYPYLPFEIWDNIFKKVLASDSKARATLALVCRDWHQLAYTTMHLRRAPKVGQRPLLECLSSLRVLFLDSDVPRSALELFRGCHQLRSLTLLSPVTPITPSFSSFTDLHELIVKIGSTSEVRAIQSLTSLTSLGLKTSGVDDLSLTSLTALTALRTLGLTQVYPDFFPVAGPLLTNLQTLKLYLNNTMPTEAFQESVRRAMDIHRVRKIEVHAQVEGEYFSPTPEDPWSWPLDFFNRALTADFRCSGCTLLELLVSNVDHGNSVNFKENLRAALRVEKDVNRFWGTTLDADVPIWYFLLFDHLDLLQELVERRVVNLRATTQWDESVLYYILEVCKQHSYASFCATLDFLLTQGVNLDEDDPSRNYTKPLYLALRLVDAQRIRALIERGARLDITRIDKILNPLVVRLVNIKARNFNEIYDIADLLKLQGIDLCTARDTFGKNILDHFLSYALTEQYYAFSDRVRLTAISEFIHALQITALHVETCEVILRKVTIEMLLHGDTDREKLDNLVDLLQNIGIQLNTIHDAQGRNLLDRLFHSSEEGQPEQERALVRFAYRLGIRANEVTHLTERTERLVNYYTDCFDAPSTPSSSSSFSSSSSSSLSESSDP